ncbi:EAL domain-containing protein [Maridesulfovibrio frigidus]|uniref:EAL domain-containing protein n=1 Tax=Maridesulfovibrio frigidus TaxID=340956 RepID=UPI0004E14FA2|nr:EAL domain-containing protein [Maridesulfovibrio frigidus]
MHNLLKKQLKKTLGTVEASFSKELSSFLELVEKTYSGLDASLLTPESPFIKILNFLPDPTFLVNKEGVIIAWNPAMEKMTGAPAETTIGKGDFEYIKIIHGKKSPGLIDLVRGSEDVGTLEYQSIRRHGKALAAEVKVENLGHRKNTHLWIQAAPITDDSGNTLGAIESIRDISARKQTENINLILYKISSALKSAPDEHSLFQTIHESLKEVIEAENFFVALYDELDETLSFPYYADEKDHISHDERICIADKRSLSAKVIQKQRPVLLLENDFERYNQEGLGIIGFSAKSWLGVPLIHNNKVIGVMTIQSYDSSNNYSTQDIDLMVAISDQIASTIQRRKAEVALRDSEQKFRSVFENATVAMFQFSTEGKLLIANPATARIMGYSSVQQMMREHPHSSDFFYNKQAWLKLMKELMTKGSVNGARIRISHKENLEKWTTVNARVTYADNGEPSSYTGTAFDSTPGIVAERNVIKHKSRFMQLFESSPQGIVLTDSEGNVIDTNKAFTRLFGYTTEQMEPCCENLCPSGEGKIKANLQRILAGATFQTEDLRKHKNGRLIPVSILGYPFEYNGEVSGTFIIYNNISHRKEFERRLSYQSLHDSLTGLPNRTLFLERLEQALTHSQKHPDHNFAVLMLDIDMFKRINDSLGHQAGDSLLIKIGERIKDCLRPIDTVARMGGDEYAVLIEDFRTPQQVIKIIRKIRNNIHNPIQVANKEVVISSSIGIVFKTAEYEHPEHILRDADISMYKAKEQGVNKFKVFNKAMQEKALQNLMIETEIRQGLPEDEFLPYFQPIYCLQTKRLAGFEALVRWNHPERGFITPGQIIPVAEETGLIVKLDRLMLLKACRAFSGWLETFPTSQDMFLTVNLSPRQLSKPDLAGAIIDILDETKFPPEMLKLEITESAIMERNAASTLNLKRIGDLGIKLAVDDFGTGYSSLAQLQRFPAATVKIDRSFISRMAEDNESLEIVRAVVALGHSLSMDVIAEGVETKEQLVLLNELGCDCVQGFYFDKPQPPEVAIDLLKMRSEGFCPPGLTSL